MTLRLTESEARVMRLAAAGLRPEEIAEALDLSRPTIAWHLAQAYRKLGLDRKGGVGPPPDPVRNAEEVQ